MANKFIAEIVISEIDINGGTGRDKDERTEKRELTAITIRDENLSALIIRTRNHLDLLNTSREG